MSSAIEHALYGNRGTHGVFNFELCTDCIRLRIAPWEETSATVLAAFSNPRLLSCEVYNDRSDGLELPWGIIGIDSYELMTGRWKFVLHCSDIEWCFESEWPVILRETVGPA